MIKLKRGEKLYKVLKPIYWGPNDPKQEGVLTKPNTYLGLNPAGAKFRAERGEVELVEDKKMIAALSIPYEEHDKEGAARHVEKKVAAQESKAKGLAEFEKRDPEGFKAHKAALAKAKKEAAKKGE